MNWNNVRSFSRGWVEHKFGTLVARTLREQRREERRLAQHRTTWHQLQARMSCIADARNYRIAGPLPVLAIARYDWTENINRRGAAQ
jgi:hypothetical protein